MPEISPREIGVVKGAVRRQRDSPGTRAWGGQRILSDFHGIRVDTGKLVRAELTKKGTFVCVMTMP
jgi:hypothetical protein